MVDTTLVGDVLLPLRLKSVFSYVIPLKLREKAGIGKRVLVHLGKSKMYAGVLKNLYWIEDREKVERLRFIEDVLDEKPVVTKQLLSLYEWIANYYMCSEGEVLNASLPKGFKMESNFVVELNPKILDTQPTLNKKERVLMDNLVFKPTLTYSEVADLVDVKNPKPIIDGLVEKGLIYLRMELLENYAVKTIRCVQLTSVNASESRLEEIFMAVSKVPKQEQVLMLVVDSFYKKKVLSVKDICDKINVSSSVIGSLVDKKMLEYIEVPVERLSEIGYRENKKDIIFTDEQAFALQKIRGLFKENKPKPVLLQGVTGSGKTHLYIELIRDALQAGKQALYLLPEIGLTKQIIDKVVSEFGEVVGVYHSRFTTAERVEIWNRVLEGRYRVIIGVRSAILLPFDSLGLIVVDEEHDHSFKQYEPNPRYNARDLAVYYGHNEEVGVVLGSATPSMESYYNALEGKYILVELKNRAVEARLPDVEVVDMRKQVDNQLSYGLFSEVLLEALRKALLKGEQAIIFRNRRGYAPYLLCNFCGNVPKCRNCDISLTFHKEGGFLKCHYCGFTIEETEKCGVCNHYEMRREGIGTERIEEHLEELFKEYRIDRMDQDSTRSKYSFSGIIERLERKEIDILVGTQMVTKGLDFENVTLVAVVQADQLLFFPDFRANEGAYQVLTQFSGRAGRSQKEGKVIIQTKNPEHFVI